MSTTYFKYFQLISGSTLDSTYTPRGRHGSSLWAWPHAYSRTYIITFPLNLGISIENIFVFLKHICLLPKDDTNME